MTTIRPTDEDARYSFETYRSYLSNLSGGMHELYGAAIYQKLLVVTRNLPAVQRVQRRSSGFSREDIVKSLRIGWVNELRLQSSGAFALDLLPALLHGAAHEAYYALYHGARAYFVSTRQAMTDTHATILAGLSNTIRQQKLFPCPWSAWCSGGPDRGEMKLGGLPSAGGATQEDPKKVTFSSSLQLALCTTRDRQIAQKKEEQRQKEVRKRLSAEASKRIAERLPATTIFDFMWRLRTRSDYRDAESFLEGISILDEAASYHRSISTITSATMGVLELLIAAHIGPGLIESAAKQFLHQTDGANAELAKRLEAIAS